MNVLITGGAGFIGSHLADALLARGHRVRAFDNLEGQVHGGKAPDYLSKDVELVVGDVRDIDAFAQALEGMDAVVHCASAVGVGQSQYEIKRYVDVNVGGTANLLQLLIRPESTVKRILVPTSMTSYGEGVYRCPTHGAVRPGLRAAAQLEKNDWQLHCPVCDAVTEPIPTPESAARESSTIYSLSKNMQEDTIMNIARVYGIGATAFRLFNVYGPRQSLSNPYTGVTAIFLSRLKNGQQPVVYEDGEQSRDFISVHDVVKAFVLALDTPASAGKVFNIGSGKKTSIVEIGKTLATLIGSPIEPRLSGEFRVNDVRHCFADNALARDILKWEPSVTLEEGLKELVAWGETQQAVDGFDKAQEELKNRRLQQ